MATGTAVIVAAALAAGVAGGGAVILLQGSSAPVPSPVPGDAAAVAALERRLERQEEEIGILRGRLEEALHARPGPGPRDGGPGLPPPGPDGALPPPSPGEEETDSSFEERFREMRGKEQEEARRAREARAETELRARLDRDVEPALTDAQKDEVVRILKERADRVRALFAEARAAGTAEAVGEAQAKAAEARAESRKALEALLTPEQLRLVDPPEGEGRAGRPGRFGGRGGRIGGRAGAGGETPPR